MSYASAGAHPPANNAADPRPTPRQRYAAVAQPLLGGHAVGAVPCQQNYTEPYRSFLVKKTPEAKAFKKPKHWTNDPAPEPKAVDPDKDEPRDLSPTRYGDWEKDGIAWDF